ncbi:MAG: hypothetical protein U0441_23915 [Polyangiaceae bacterium]
MTSACGGGSGSGGSGGTGTGGSGGTGTTTSSGPACDGEPATLDLAGTWAAYGALTVSIVGAPGSLVSICPADQEGQAFLTLFVTIGQDAADPTKLQDVKATLCAIDLPAVGAVAGTCDPGSMAAVTTQITVPDALLDALPTLAANVVGGTLSGESKGADVSLEQFVVTAGATTKGAALPKWDVQQSGCTAGDIGHSSTCEATCVNDCAALVDDDKDGFPGVTLGVCGRAQGEEQKPCNVDDPSQPGVTIQGRAFVALEVNPQFSGKAESSCKLDGSVTTDVVYQVVGADVTLSSSEIPVASAIQALPTLVVKPDQSKLTMVRVDGKYATPDLKIDPADPLTSCQTVVAKRNELF